MNVVNSASNPGTLRRRALRNVAAATVCLLGSTAALAQLQLVWSDEFDGSSLDQNNWEYMIGDGCSYGICGWGNNELEWYTSRPENIFVANGMLNIVAREDWWQGHQYTSARIRSMNRADFLYGRIEARIRLPQGEGLWPAFWMLPTNSPYGGWARSGEIDILETVDVPWQAHGTLIYGENWPEQVYNGATHSLGVNLADGFHVYALEWEPDEMRWYVDGVHYHTVTSSTWWSAAAPGNPRAPFDTPFHLLLNAAVGGDWPGPPDGSTQFPQTMTVDYVRVYDFCDGPCPTPGDPLVAPGRIEAENYDEGGEGVAYHDADPANQGGAYRADGVDIEVASHGGYNVGWIEPNEWLQYTTTIQVSGTYDIVAEVASPASSGVFGVWLDGVQLGQDFVVPTTGDWQIWTSLEQRVSLPEGAHVLRFQNKPGSSDFNLSYFDFFLAADGNRDHDVDFSDLQPLLFCMTGPEASPTAPVCISALDGVDIDRDGDIDLTDAAEFQRVYGSY